jgi:hypothetical protein
VTHPNRQPPHSRGDSNTIAAIGIVLVGCVVLVLLVCMGVPLYLVGISLVLTTTPTPIYGCIALHREEDIAYFLNQCTDQQVPLPFWMDNGAHVEWGSDARTGLLWLYIQEPRVGALDEYWVLMQACQTAPHVRVFDGPEQLNDAMMRDHGVLINASQSLQSLGKPEPLYW